MLLDGAKEAYELSFVAVPAQPRAGTHKSIGFTKPVSEVEPEEKTQDEETDTTNKDLELLIEVSEAESFILFNQN